VLFPGVARFNLVCAHQSRFLRAFFLRQFQMTNELLGRSLQWAVLALLLMPQLSWSQKAPPSPSCSSITDVDDNAVCNAKANKDTSWCGNIANFEKKSLCKGMALGNWYDCDKVSSFSLKRECVANARDLQRSSIWGSRKTS